MRFHELVKGDVAEHQAIIWLWQKGYLVCKNLSQHGPVDLVAIKENETILIDVKSVSIRKRDGYAVNRTPTALQKKLGVKILKVNTKTGECNYV